MRNNGKKTMKALIITMFFACIITTINVFVYNFYYLRKIYKNVYTADGEWILSFGKFVGYFQNKIGLALSLINLLIILVVIIIYIFGEIKDRKDN